MPPRRNGSSRILLGALALASCLACHRRLDIPPWPPPTFPIAEEPRLGATSPVQGPTRYREVAASAQTYPSYRVEFGGVVYDLGVDERYTIRYISTDDAKFSTPEGIAVGSSQADVAKTGALPLFHEPGWGCHTQLPSGWRAAFIVGERDEPCGERVAWLFKR